jgi:uncharacterized protein
MEVVENPDEERFEAREGDEVLGFAVYRRRPGLIAFTHTEVDPSHEGEGVGGTLVREARDAVRGEGIAVLPFCPFVNAYIKKHPDYTGLVPEAYRGHFGL